MNGGRLTAHWPLMDCPDGPHDCTGTEFQRLFDGAPHVKDDGCERRGCTKPGHSAAPWRRALAATVAESAQHDDVVIINAPRQSRSPR